MTRERSPGQTLLTNGAAGVPVGGIDTGNNFQFLRLNATNDLVIAVNGAVDTELPAAVLASTTVAQALPTSPAVTALLEVPLAGGSTTMLPPEVDPVIGAEVRPYLGVVAFKRSAATNAHVADLAARDIPDAALTGFGVSGGMLYNGATWDRQRGTAGVADVNTELPAAALLVAGTGAALPTTPTVAAIPAVINAADGLAYPAMSAVRLGTENRGIPITAIALASAATSSHVEMVTGRDATDASVGSDGPPVYNAVYEGYNTQWNRQRGNEQATGLVSAARTATTSTPDQKLHNGRGVAVEVDVTAYNAVAAPVLTIQTKDELSGVYTVVLTGTAITATGHYRFVVYPGITAVAGSRVSDVMSRIWRATMTPASADSVTYSVVCMALV